MKLKTVEVEGTQYAEVREGKPVYVGDDGKEHVYDAPAMRGSLDRLNESLKEERAAKDALDQQVKAFGDLDPEKAREALQTVRNLDDKKLIDAGEVERIRKEVSEETAKSYQKKLDEANATAEQLQTQYAAEKVNGAFVGSKFVKEKLVIPADMVQAAFGRHFQFKDGRITPVDQNGNPIYSDSNPGDIAPFDEALEKLVNQYPHRDSILKGSGHNGSGAGPTGEGGTRTVSRKQFEQLSPAEQSKYAASAAKGEVRITD
tara:strand:+ start:17381 stop:18160 length:780 start_codon:yes stop_codon:yes gene_type:complete